MSGGGVAGAGVSPAEVLEALLIEAVDESAAVAAARVVLGADGPVQPDVLLRIGLGLPQPSAGLWFWHHSCRGTLKRSYAEEALRQCGLPADVIEVLAWCLGRGVDRYLADRAHVDRYLAALRVLEGHVREYGSFAPVVHAVREGRELGLTFAQLPDGWSNRGLLGGRRLAQAAATERSALIARGRDPDMPVAPMPRRLGVSEEERALCRQLLDGFPGIRGATPEVRGVADLLADLTAERRAPWREALGRAGLVPRGASVEEWLAFLAAGAPVEPRCLEVLAVGPAGVLMWTLAPVEPLPDVELAEGVEAGLAALDQAPEWGEHRLHAAHAVLGGLAARGRGVAGLVARWRQSTDLVQREVAGAVLAGGWRDLADPGLRVLVLTEQLEQLNRALHETVIDLERAA